MQLVLEMSIYDPMVHKACMHQFCLDTQISSRSTINHLIPGVSDKMLSGSLAVTHSVGLASLHQETIQQEYNSMSPGFRATYFKEILVAQQRFTNRS